MTGRADGREGRWIRVCLALLALVPAGITAANLAGGGSDRLALVSLALSGLALAALVLSAKRPTGVAGPALAAIFTTGALFLGMRAQSIELFLVLAAAAFILAALLAFAGGRRGAAGLAFFAALLLLLLAGAEFAWSRLEKGGRATTQEIEGKIREKGVRRAWRHRPGSSQHHVVRLPDGSVELDVTYEIGEDGRRIVSNRPEKGAEVFLCGGSYTFGHSVNEPDSLPHLLQERMPDTRIENCAANGIGAADVQIGIEEILPKHPDVELCVYLMIEDHFRRAACPDSMTRMKWGRLLPRFELVDGEPVFRGGAYESLGLLRRLSVDLQIRSSLFRSIASGWTLGEKDEALVAALIRKMKEDCDRLPDCRFALVILPSRTPTGLPRYDLDGWITGLAERGIRVIDLRQAFEEHLSASGGDLDRFFYSTNHPKPELQRWLADELAPELESVLAAPRDR